jgi:hypothetical protein
VRVPVIVTFVVLLAAAPAATAPVPTHLMRDEAEVMRDGVQGTWRLAAVRDARNVDYPPWADWVYEFRGGTLTTNDPAQTQYRVCRFRFDTAGGRTRLTTTQWRCLDKKDGAFVCDSDDRVYSYAIQNGRLLLGFCQIDAPCDPLNPAQSCFVLVFAREPEGR